MSTGMNLSATRRAIVILAVAQAIFISLCLSRADASPADDLQFAAALFNDGEYRQALDEFTRLGPQAAGGEWADDLLYWMAECHFHLKEFAAADDLYRKLIATHPDFPRVDDAYLKLMGAYYSTGQFDKVLENAEAFSRKFPNSASNEQVYLVWIQSALRLKKYGVAEQRLEAFQKLAPGSPYVWSLKSIFANFYLKDQKYDKALPYFEELYGYQKDANFLLWIGECRFQAGAWAGARDAFALFLQEHPSNEVAGFKRGLCEYKLNNAAQAIEAFAPFAARDGDYTEDALYFIAQSLMKEGKAEEAKSRLNRILSLSPNEELRARAIDQLMRLEAEGKDPSKLVDIYEKFGQAGSVSEVQQYRAYLAYQKQDFRTVITLLKDPKDRREMLMLAESHYAVGNYIAAADAYTRLLSASNSSVEKKSAHVGLGWSAYAQEQYEPALKSFESYLALEPSAPSDVHLAMAQCALALGRTEKAVSYYDRARATSPDQKKIARNLGILYFNSGEYAKAIEALAGVDEDDQILSVIGRACLYLKQPAKALTYLRRLKRPERYALEIGAVHYELGQLEEAKTYFERAAQSPAAAGVNIDEFLGIIAYNQGNYPDAAARLRKAQLRDPNNIEIRFELAASLVRIENAPQQELEEILRGLINHPSAPRSYRDKARMWLARRSTATDTAGVMNEIKQISDPGDQMLILEQRASQFFAQQSYDQAVVIYDRLLAAPGLPPETRMQALYGLGWSLNKTGKKDRALAAFRSLLADYPKSSYASEVVLLLVEDAYGEGLYSDAADLALKHMKKMSKNVDRLRFMAAESLYEIRRYADALEYYRAYLPAADRLSDYVRYRAGLCAYHLRRLQRAHEFFSPITDSSLLERKNYYLGMILYDQGKKTQAADFFEKIVDAGGGEFKDEAWKNLVILIEDQGLWRKGVSLGARLSESPAELDRLIYAKSLLHTRSSLAARYAEKLGYIAKDQAIASEALYVAVMANVKIAGDKPKAKQVYDRLAAKYPKSRFVAEAQKEIESRQ